MKEIFIFLFRVYLKIITFIFSKFSLEKKVVIFSSNGNTYDCNPRIILEKLSEEKKVRIVCVVNQEQELELKENVTYIKNKNKNIMSLLSLYHINTCKILITNTRLKYPEYLNKRKGQYYIQTWHSSIRIKKIEGDAIKFLNKKYKQLAIKESRKIDFILSGNRFTTEIIERAFFYDNLILEYGNPRVDFLIKNKENKDILKENYLDFKNKKILFYCPTFRVKEEEEILNHNFENWLELLEKNKNEDWMILIKYHPNTRVNTKKRENNSKIKIIKNELTAQQIVLISDLVVTDFSSIMFDCIFAAKRCILYSKDFDEYIKTERELYFEYDELPFESYSQIKFLETVNKKVNYLEKYDKFLKKIGSFEDGNSVDKVIKKIYELFEKN